MEFKLLDPQIGDIGLQIQFLAVYVHVSCITFDAGVCLFYHIHLCTSNLFANKCDTVAQIRLKCNQKSSVIRFMINCVWCPLLSA